MDCYRAHMATGVIGHNRPLVILVQIAPESRRQVPIGAADGCDRQQEVDDISCPA